MHQDKSIPWLPDKMSEVMPTEPKEIQTTLESQELDYHFYFANKAWEALPWILVGVFSLLALQGLISARSGRRKKGLGIRR